LELSSIKILIVDDDEADRQDLANVLQRRIPGLIVEPAEGYEEAILKITASKYDCVLIDFRLQGKDGLELLREIRTHKGYEFCALIVITGQGSEEVAVEAMKGSAHDYLLKDQILEPRLIQSIETACTKAKLAEHQHLQLETRKNFAALAAHELNTPLTTLSGFLQMIELKLEGAPPDIQSYIELAIKNVNYMNTLVGSLLSYAQTGESNETIRLVALDHALGSALDLVRREILETQAQVSYSVLPMVYGRQNELIQLFRNLIGNAIRYRSAEPLKIEIHSVIERDVWHISVSDNGIGIPSKMRTQVFEPLQRAHTTGTSGHGLGLAISAKIVQSLGGRIWCEEAAEGHGCKFVFTLPVVEEKPVIKYNTPFSSIIR